MDNETASPKQAKKLIKTIAFYFSFSFIALLLEKLSPTGPCVPGLGVLSFLLLIPISLVLCIYNFVRVEKGDRSNLPSGIIHLSVFLVMFLVIGL